MNNNTLTREAFGQTLKGRIVIFLEAFLAIVIGTVIILSFFLITATESKQQQLDKLLNLAPVCTGLSILLAILVAFRPGATSFFLYKLFSVDSGNIKLYKEKVIEEKKNSIEYHKQRIKILEEEIKELS